MVVGSKGAAKGGEPKSGIGAGGRDGSRVVEDWVAMGFKLQEQEAAGDRLWDD